jgi:hypothetical protein
MVSFILDHSFDLLTRYSYYYFHSTGLLFFCDRRASSVSYNQIDICSYPFIWYVMVSLVYLLCCAGLSILDFNLKYFGMLLED